MKILKEMSKTDKENYLQLNLAQYICLCVMAVVKNIVKVHSSRYPES